MPAAVFPGVGYITSLSGSAATETGKVIATNNFAQISWFIVGSGTVTDGVVKIETAHANDYSGTWHELDSVDFSANALTNACYYGTYPGNALMVRARVSTAITSGGTVSVHFCGLQSGIGG